MAFDVNAALTAAKSGKSTDGIPSISNAQAAVNATLAYQARNKPLEPVNPLGGTPQQLAAKPKVASLTSIVAHDLGSEVKTGVKAVIGGGAKAVRANARPVIDVATGQGGKAVHDAAQLSSDYTGGTANYLGSTVIANPIKETAAQVTGNKPVEAKDTEASNKELGLGASGTNIKSGLIKGGAEAANTATYLVGGAEVKGLKAALTTAKDTATQAAVKTTGRVIAEKSAEGTATGAVGGASQTLTNNPNATAKQIRKNAAVGAAIGGAIPVAAGGLKQVFGKAAGKTDLPTTTKIPVTDESTGSVAGKVSTELPQVNFTKPVPSDEGYNDAEFRTSIGKQNAVNAAQKTPGVADAFQETGSKDPLTLVVHSLATGNKASVIGSTVDNLIPGLDSQVKNKLVSDIKSTQDPQQVAHLLFNASKDNEAAHPALVATAPGKKISFTEPPAGTVDGTAPLPFGDVPAGPREAGATVPTPATLEDAPHNTAPNAKTSLLDQAPKVAEGDTKQAVLNRDFVAAKYQDYHAPIAAASKGMSARDAKLLESVENPYNHSISDAAAARRVENIAKTADNPGQFRNVVQAIKNFTDTHYATSKTIPGQEDLGYRQNYLPHETTLVDKNGKPVTDAARDPEQVQTRVTNGKPSYTHQRVFNTLTQRANYLGPNGEHYVRTNGSILDDVHAAIDRASAQHGAAALQKGLNEAHPGQVQVGKIGRGTDGQEYDQLKIAGGKALSLPKELAAQYNKRAAAEKSTGLLKAYDAANRGVKYAKLGGGMFHALTTAGSVLGQQLTSAHTYLHPLATASSNLKLIASTLSKKTSDKILADHAHTGVLDYARKVGVTLSSKEITGDASLNVLEKAKESTLNPIRAIHDAVFKRQIPQAKLMIIKQGLQSKFGEGVDFHNPTAEQLAYGRSLAKGVNNLGGINRAVDGLTPKTAQKVNRVVLAGDFTEGKFRTIYNSVAKGGAEGRVARQLVVGKSILFALPGLAALVSTGNLDPSDPKAVAAAFAQQILDPSVSLGTKGPGSKTNPNGTPQEAKLPSTFISEVGKIIAPALTGLSASDKKTGVESAAESYATNRLAAAPALGLELAKNKDFYGNPILGNDANGNRQSPLKQAINVASQVSPIPVVQGAKAISGSQTARDAVLNTAGFEVKNNPNSAEGQKTQVQEDKYNTTQALISARAKVTKQMNVLFTEGKQQQALRLANDFNTKTLPAIVNPFRTKYAANYNPAWDDKDQGFLSHTISTSSQASGTRESALKEAQLQLQTP